MEEDQEEEEDTDDEQGHHFHFDWHKIGEMISGAFDKVIEFCIDGLLEEIASEEYKKKIEKRLGRKIDEEEWKEWLTANRIREGKDIVENIIHGGKAMIIEKGEEMIENKI